MAATGAVLGTLHSADSIIMGLPVYGGTTAGPPSKRRSAAPRPLPRRPQPAHGRGL
ncbi:hypothetical protein QJS66_15370 [Kocuria rhizophila]|nr:hypothetical protein QJS66_15370 [Kocuria rhizophila]